MSISIETVNDQPSKLGEAPFWLSKSKKLIQVDCLVGDLLHTDPVKKHSEKTKLANTLTFAIPCTSDSENTFIYSDHRRLCKINLSTKERTILGEVESDLIDVVTCINDGKCDAKGRLWTGTAAMAATPDEMARHRGSLYCYSPSESDQIVKKVPQITWSNGLAWSPDNRVFYYIDSMTRSIDAFDFDLETASLSNRRTVFDFEVTPGFEDCGYPDGMCVDTKGNLWVACYLGGRVINIEPKSGSLLRTIKFPVTKTTSCCFGGEDNSELFVTSAWFDLTDEEKAKQPKCGLTFRVKGLGVSGTPVYCFNG